jgi:hypothetical protein
MKTNASYKFTHGSAVIATNTSENLAQHAAIVQMATAYILLLSYARATLDYSCSVPQ